MRQRRVFQAASFLVAWEVLFGLVDPYAVPSPVTQGVGRSKKCQDGNPQ